MRNEKPDTLELQRLLLKAEKADGKEKAALLREAANEALLWAQWHNRSSVEMMPSRRIHETY